MAKLKSAKRNRKAETFALKGEWDGSGDVLPLEATPSPERSSVTVLPLDRGEMEWQRYRYCRRQIGSKLPKAASKARWHSSPAPSLMAAFTEMANDESRLAKVRRVNQAKRLAGWDHVIL